MSCFLTLNAHYRPAESFLVCNEPTSHQASQFQLPSLTICDDSKQWTEDLLRCHIRAKFQHRSIETHDLMPQLLISCAAAGTNIFITDISICEVSQSNILALLWDKICQVNLIPIIVHSSFYYLQILIVQDEHRKSARDFAVQSHPHHMKCKSMWLARWLPGEANLVYYFPKAVRMPNTNITFYRETYWKSSKVRRFNWHR